MDSGAVVYIVTRGNFACIGVQLVRDPSDARFWSFKKCFEGRESLYEGLLVVEGDWARPPGRYSSGRCQRQDEPRARDAQPSCGSPGWPASLLTEVRGTMPEPPPEAATSACLPPGGTAQ